MLSLDPDSNDGKVIWASSTWGAGTVPKSVQDLSSQPTPKEIYNDNWQPTATGTVPVPGGAKILSHMINDANNSPNNPYKSSGTVVTPEHVKAFMDADGSLRPSPTSSSVSAGDILSGDAPNCPTPVNTCWDKLRVGLTIYYKYSFTSADYQTYVVPDTPKGFRRPTDPSTVKGELVYCSCVQTYPISCYNFPGIQPCTPKNGQFTYADTAWPIFPSCLLVELVVIKI